MTGRRVLAVTLGGVLVLGLVAYAGASWVLFDKASSVAAHCGTSADGSPRFAEYTPASFGTAGVSADITAAGFDTTPYAMPDYGEVRFQSRDGVDLVGWWVPGDRPDAAAVIAIHGKGSCRHDPVLLLPAGMLHRNGFAVLMVDLRDMGDSEVVDGRYSGGTQEYMDVLGAWDWLRARGLPAERIGLLGESNGAATVVIAAGEEPGIAATWEDSGYSDTSTVIREEVRFQGFPEVLTVGATLWARLYGIDLDEHRPIDAIPKIGTRRLAINHGISDDRVQPHHALDFARAREAVVGKDGPDVEPWFVAGAEHVQLAFAAPAEYERRMVQFFTEALGDPAQP
jgi:dipeptidyl aminopeptidase/acylaminoacyl peptidase